MLVDVNLLPEKEKQDGTWLVVAASLLALFLLAFYVLRSLAAQEEAEVSALQTEQQELAVTIAQQQGGENEDEAYYNKVTELEEAMIPISSVLHRLISLLPEGSAISGIDYSYPGNMQVTVRVEEIRQAATFQRSLIEEDIFSEATMETMNHSDPLDDDFHLEGRVPRYEAIFDIRIAGESLRSVGEKD